MTPSTRQSRVLRVLADRGAQTTASIAAALGLPTTGAYDALSALQGAGLVGRERDANGIASYHLTIAGAEMLRAQGVGQ